jgi:hypothetical protein
LEDQLKLTRDVFAIGKMVALEKRERFSAGLPLKFTKRSDFGCG